MKEKMPKYLLLLFVLFVVILVKPSSILAASIKRSLADVNRDGVVDLLDSTIVGGYYLYINPTGKSALADVTQNGVVDVGDYSLIGNVYHSLTTSCQIADINNDTDVDAQDLVILRDFMGQTDTSANMHADLNGDGVINSLDEDTLNLNLGCSWFSTKLDTSPSTTSDNTPSFSGIATVVNNGTDGTIVSVSYSLDDGPWTSTGVSAFDGAFEGYTEHFLIKFTNYLNEGTHTLKIKSISSMNTESGISSYTFTVVSKLPTLPQLADIQIPGSSSFWNIKIATPIFDSNTDSHEVIAVIQPQTFDFNAYLSANIIEPKEIVKSSAMVSNNGTTDNNAAIHNSIFNFVSAGGGDGTIIGVKTKETVLWQVGNIQNMWYKKYAENENSPEIIGTELQNKKSIIALKYSHADLIPPGYPNTQFSELKLKLAHSLDGKEWTTIPSVVDPINNTVATYDKLGGYYMIVGTY